MGFMAADQGGLCPGVSVESWWCLGCLSVVSRLSGGVSVVRWCLRCLLVVSLLSLGGVLVVSRCCLGGLVVSVVSGCCLGRALAVVLWWCLGGVSMVLHWRS